MKRIIIPQPPDSRRSPYRGNPDHFMAAASDWMMRVKGILEDASRINDTPMGQQFLVSDFTTATTVTGTTTGTDLSNVVASLVAAMTASGMVSPTIKRGDV